MMFMASNMFRMTGEKLKVLYTVIILNVINMMNHLFWIKVSTNMLLHNISVFFNVTMKVAIRMFWFHYENIPFMYSSTTSPIRGIFSSTILSDMLSIANPRTHYATLPEIKERFVTYHTIMLNPISPPSRFFASSFGIPNSHTSYRTELSIKTRLIFERFKAVFATECFNFHKVILLQENSLVHI